MIKINKELFILSENFIMWAKICENIERDLCCEKNIINTLCQTDLCEDAINSSHNCTVVRSLLDIPHVETDIKCDVENSTIVIVNNVTCYLITNENESVNSDECNQNSTNFCGLINSTIESSSSDLMDSTVSEKTSEATTVVSYTTTLIGTSISVSTSGITNVVTDHFSSTGNFPLNSTTTATTVPITTHTSVSTSTSYITNTVITTKDAQNWTDATHNQPTSVSGKTIAISILSVCLALIVLSLIGYFVYKKVKKRNLLNGDLDMYNLPILHED